MYAAWTSAPDLTTCVIATVIGFAAVAGALWQYSREPASAVELDAALRKVYIRRCGLFGRKVEERAFSEIAAVELEVGEHSEGGAIHRPVLRLRSGEQTPISMFWYQTRDPSEMVVARIEDFLNNT